MKSEPTPIGKPDGNLLKIFIHSFSRKSQLQLSFNEQNPQIQLFRLIDDPDADHSKKNETYVCALTTQLLALGSHYTAIHTTDSQIHCVTFPDTDSSILITPTENSFTCCISSTSQNYVQADFDLHSASWFGLGHLMNHHWPLDDAALVLSPAYPFDNGPSGLSTLLDPTFVSSIGALVSINDHSPCLHLAVNSPYPLSSSLLTPYIWTTGLGNLLRQILPHPTPIATPRLLTAQSRLAYDHSHILHPWSSAPASIPSSSSSTKKPSLTFSLSATANVREATILSLANLRTDYGPAPCSPSKLTMMEYPIWSTWAKFKADINQDKVLSFATQIAENNLPRSVMGIDDCWSTAYGELCFDPVKFPDPAEMVRQLHQLGFMVTLWVTPFANVTSAPLTDLTTQKHYVTMPDGDVGKFEWWRPGPAAALDVTNPNACEWFVGQLQALRDNYGIDGFKFDAGEPCFLPTGFASLHNLTSPNDYTRAWIHNIASKFPIAEVRSAVRGCQSASPMFRIFDRYSTWGLKNGLASVLTAVLTSGILGFPFCIPDYVAGNAYGDEVPEAELMIRWTQASVAMPALQLSIPPWHFNDDTCAAAVADALRWRERLFWPHIKACVADASDKLWPIVRPMWWAEPELHGVNSIYDQFMVGSRVVVAPIITKGQRERPVFLPSGLWRRVDLSVCKPCGEHFTGPIRLENVPAGLSDMPVFVSDLVEDGSHVASTVTL